MSLEEKVEAVRHMLHCMGFHNLRELCESDQFEYVLYKVAKFVGSFRLSYRVISKAMGVL